MKVTVNFGNVRVIVPCGNGDILVRKLMDLSVTRYKKALGKPPDAWITIHNLKLSCDGGILDPDDQLNDVADDREQIIAVYEEQGSLFPPHNEGDGTSASSVGTESPDIFRGSEQAKEPFPENDVEITADCISNGLTALHVRRGSESALNCLSSISTNLDPSKRWSAAVIIDDGPCGTSKSSPNEDLGHSLKEVEACQEDYGFTRVSQGPRRLSILGSGSNVLSWEEAADRQLLRNQDTRKEPLGGSGVSSDQSRDRDSESLSVSGDRENPVTLKNVSGPLGIHVIPDYDSNGRNMGLVVHGVEPGGRVDQDGQLHVGDRIIDINGQSLLHVSFQKAQEIFKDALREPELRIRFAKSPLSTCSVQNYKKPPPPVYPKPVVKKEKPKNESERAELVEGQEKGSNSKVVTVTSTKNTCLSVTLNQKNISLTSNTRKIGQKIVIKLTKGQDGFGFSITTRDNPAGGNCPIYVKNILPRGAAIQDGRLKPGDRLLKVNEEEMTGLSQTEAVEILRNIPLGGTVNLVVSRQEINPTSSSDLPQETLPDKDEDELGIYPLKHKEIMTFDIPLNDTELVGLGVSVKGKTGTTQDGSVDLGIFVKSIIHGGAASKDGRLHVNDQLVKINGISLLKMKNTEAMEMLRCAVIKKEGFCSTPEAITLTIARQTLFPFQDLENSVSFLSSFSQNSSTFYRSGNCSTGDMQENSTSLLENELSMPDNSTSESLENTVILVPRSRAVGNFDSENVNMDMQETKLLGRNPVIDKLTGQDTKTSALGSHLYFQKSHENWDNNQFLTLHGEITRQDSLKNDPTFSPTVNLPTSESVIIEGLYENTVQPKSFYRSSVLNNLHSASAKNTSHTEGSKTVDSEEQTTLVTSQLSLDDESQFTLSRDGLGRQSMSEKRHAQLDARNTDTFQRNKQAREEQQESEEQENHQPRGVFISKEQKNVSSGGDNFNNMEPQVQGGSSLGLRKSSSLENLQTVIQELQKEEYSEVSFSSCSTGKTTRGCGSKESFRTAVDHSYEGPIIETMETLDEDRESNRSVGQEIHTQVSTTRNIEQTTVSTHAANEQQNSGKTAKKKGLLKGLGSVFKFGKNKKSQQEQGNKLSRKETKEVEEQLQARQAAQEEEERIQEQYRKLVEKQKQEQQKQQTYINESLVPVNQIPLQTRQERMLQLRAQIQRQHEELQGHYPKDKEEEVYEKEIMDAIHHQPRQETEAQHGRFKSLGIFKEMGRPGSRMGFADPSKYVHYMNYKEIQQHLQEFRQNRPQNLSRKLQNTKPSPVDRRDRPISNFFEYDSMQIHQQVGFEQNMEPITNSLPRHSSLLSHPQKQSSPSGQTQYYKSHQTLPLQSVEIHSLHRPSVSTGSAKLQCVSDYLSDSTLLLSHRKSVQYEQGPGTKV